VTGEERRLASLIMLAARGKGSYARYIWIRGSQSTSVTISAIVPRTAGPELCKKGERFVWKYLRRGHVDLV
jgi:hypothetical protein